MLDQCTFHNNSFSYQLTAVKNKRAGNVTFVARDTVFSHLQYLYYVLKAHGLSITFKGKTIFRNIRSKQVLLTTKNSSLTFDGYTELSAIFSRVLISTDQIQLQRGTIMNITQTKVSTALFSDPLEKLVYNVPKEFFSPLYPICLFQYINETMLAGQYSILITETNAPRLCTKFFCTSHCHLDDTVDISQDINRQVIYTDNSSKNLTHDYKTICYCTDSQNYACLVDKLPGVYPGQTLNISLALQFESQPSAVVNVEYNYHNLPKSACKIINTPEIQQEIYNTCTQVSYTIEYNDLGWCELFFSHLDQKSFFDSASKSRSYHFVKMYNAYYIKYLPCPIGFKINENNVCDCDPELLLALPKIDINCNINDQTISRPANSWISVDPNDNHSYLISQYCPFDYCFPLLSHLNLALPDSQCKFKRTGTLCGQCGSGLSVVFGSSQCKQCSNVFLLLIIPIGVAGIIVVLLLFILNLTVTDGGINAFLFYGNIIEINNHIFVQFSKIPRIVISLANLDLGFEACFYDGMDDYAKMFLQLVFPAYLILIAVVLITSSRYSTRIQRLTARRALPVLATLFLLSYTKVLRTISYMLFYYHKITNISTKQTNMIWAVDTTVPIFGARFIVAFIVSLILFLILLSFNFVLLFRRILSYFNFVNRFKPLLDAYQGPYKDKFYYWTGLQLVIRAVFFGLSALDRNTNLMISTLFIGIFVGVHGMVHPFTSKARNFHEFLILLNLHGIFVFSMYSSHIVINFLALLVLLHFTAILLQHVKGQWCEKYYTNWINICLKSRIQKYIKRPKQRTNIQPDIKSIPDITYNYKEFQEPLIGFEK